VTLSLENGDHYGTTYKIQRQKARAAQVYSTQLALNALCWRAHVSQETWHVEMAPKEELSAAK